MNSTTNLKRKDRPEIALAGLAVAVIILLHLYFLFHAGGLWRDEIDSVSIATLPSLGKLWSSLVLESFPALSLLVFRGWSTFAHTDFVWRMLGCAIGLAIAAMYYVNTEEFCLPGASRGPDAKFPPRSRLPPGKRNAFPLVAWSLIGGSSLIIRWGDSLRGYGLGCLLILFAYGRLRTLSRKPTSRNLLFACLATVLSVQCLYQNAFLVAALCLAAAAAAFLSRNHRAGLTALAAGFVAALSLVPYIPVIRSAKQLWIVGDVTVDWSAIARVLGSALSQPASWTRIGWLGLLALALVAGTISLRSPRESHGISSNSLYALISAIAAAAFFLAFIKIARLAPKDWYFLPLLALEAQCAESLLASAGASSPARWIRWLAVPILLGPNVTAAVRSLSMPQTDVDYVAGRVAKLAAPQDRVIVMPWYLGTTFARYYRGPAPWTTVPRLSDFSVQRLDLLKEQMRLENAIDPILSDIDATLRSGRRVWLVGPIPSIPHIDAPARLAPAPLGPQGWNEGPYVSGWASQVFFVLERDAREFHAVIPLRTGPTGGMENASLYLAEGWRASHHAAPASKTVQ